ncbi:MAG: YdbL family protein [Gallionella sp.]|jgi:uncharacterized protein YdbL (DUF1318 family)|nr:YdbL family protein [Gallionella sp.]
MNVKSTLLRLLSVGLLSLSMAAWAIDLQSAKAAGQVGEKADGYLGVVINAPGVPALVQDINQKRRAAYQDIAQKNGTSLQAVEELAGRKALEKTPPGQFIMSPGGQWIRK